MDDRFCSGDGIVGSLMNAFSTAINCETNYVGTFEKKSGNPHLHMLVHIDHPEITNSRIKLAEKIFTELVKKDRSFRNDLRIERIPVDSNAYHRCSEYLTGAGKVFIGKSAPTRQVLDESIDSEADIEANYYKNPTGTLSRALENAT